MGIIKNLNQKEKEEVAKICLKKPVSDKMWDEAVKEKQILKKVKISWNLGKILKENFRLNYQIEFLASFTRIRRGFSLVRTKKKNLGVELIERIRILFTITSENPFYFEANPEKENLRKVPW